jgi:hypothetical protein
MRSKNPKVLIQGRKIEEDAHIILYIIREQGMADEALRAYRSS